MSDANGKRDLSALGRWYSQAGTPELTIKTAYSDFQQTFTPHFLRTTYDQEFVKTSRKSGNGGSFARALRKRNSRNFLSREKLEFLGEHRPKRYICTS
jgi:aminopeptidase N